MGLTSDTLSVRSVIPVPVPIPPGLSQPSVSGMILTRDGRLLLLADGFGVDVIDAARASEGDQAAVLGHLDDPQGRGTIELAVSPDDRYLFATEEAAATVTVFDLAQARRSNFNGTFIVGRVGVAHVPVGIAISPDARRLYVTTEDSPGRPSSATGPQIGTLTVIDTARAERGDPNAVLANVNAGCSPVRVVLSGDGRRAWVTARASNALLVFDTDRLVGRRRPLLGWSRVGPAPVGIALLDHDTLAAVANSNRFVAPQQPQTIDIIDIPALLARRPSVIGHLPVGGFPRELILSPDGRHLLLTNFGTNSVETINVSNLPIRAGRS
jgi:DNA-binding beta-propeller fold protein YncE